MQVGCADILGRIVEDLKDESEPYRRMVMETIDKVVRDLGTADVDARLEELLIDGILYAFQEQVSLLATVHAVYSRVPPEDPSCALLIFINAAAKPCLKAAGDLMCMSGCR